MAPTFLAGGGELGALMRAFPWASSSLGGPETWPEALRTLVRVMLASKQPMFVAWGPERIMLYNDGYAPLCGSKHPSALGRPFAEVWADIIGDVGPIMDAAYAGTSTYMDDIRFRMLRNGYPEDAHFSFSYTPVFDESAGQVVGMFCTCQETTHELALSRARSEEIERLRMLFEQAPSAMALLTGPEHIFDIANPAYVKLIGGRPVLGRSVAEALPEIREQGILALLDQVFQSGEAYVGDSTPINFITGPGGKTEERLIDFVYQPIRDGAGTVVSIFVQAVDVTEQRQAAQVQDVLNHELSHRMKNQMAMVQSLVNQTLRNATDVEQARATIIERISVLARAHDILLIGRGTRASVRSVVEQAARFLEIGRNDQFTVTGPDLVVGSRAALSLALIVHELTTNALKHGALTDDNATIAIEWGTIDTDEGAMFTFRWTESGGPAVSPPSRIGLGSRLIRGGISGASSSVTLEFAPEGLQCLILASLSGVQAER
jgi:PAS domain S-box-containing protein